MSRSAGRPRRGESSLERWQIIAKAFEILDAEGADGLTMRALGRALGVTPMALYHHVGSRTELFAAMSEAIYATLATTPAGLRATLRGYCEQVLAHPNLTLAIFAMPELYAGAAERLTEHLIAMLREMGLDERGVKRWLDILVDYTHGFALAIAAGRRSGAVGSIEDALLTYDDELDTLLDAISVRP
jgi:AcrR family transcriptional regulator